jgi:hypothetical protein
MVSDFLATFLGWRWRSVGQPLDFVFELLDGSVDELSAHPQILGYLTRLGTSCLVSLHNFISLLFSLRLSSLVERERIPQTLDSSCGVQRT